jgi:cytochrome c oxidase assembly factor CtaG
MSSATEAVLASWSFPPFLTALNLLISLLYVRGWIPLYEVIPSRFTHWRLACFLSGVGLLQIALASPIDTLDPFLLTSHMLQHMLLMMVIPPLLLLGDPTIPLLKGLPNWISRDILGPFLTWPARARIGQLLTHPVVALCLVAVAVLGWHVPAAYELALRSPDWHEVEHVCFLGTSMLFWWPVIQPWPSRPRWPRWAIPLYLLLGDFVNSVPAALLAFSERVLYPSYSAVPRLARITTLQDQVAAGALMWVIGSFAFLIPAALLIVGLLSPESAASPSKRKPTRIDLRVPRYVFPLTFVLLLGALTCGLLAPQTADTDGTIVRMQGVSGPFRMSVFAPPILYAGASDVFVLVQDRNSDEVILDAAVDLAAKPAVGTEGMTRVQAERRLSTNKLLHTATLELASPGRWELNLSIRRGSDEGSLSTQLKVETSAAESIPVWLYPLLGSVVIAIVAFHRLIHANTLTRSERFAQFS